jgi:hypothetical protein
MLHVLQRCLLQPLQCRLAGLTCCASCRLPAGPAAVAVLLLLLLLLLSAAVKASCRVLQITGHWTTQG